MGKMALAENNSMVAFDARINPGASEKLLHQVALCCLKNIEKAKTKGLLLISDWLYPEIYSKGIPLNILHGVGLRHPDEKERSSKRSRSRNTRTSRARSSQPSNMSGHKLN